MNLNIVHHPYYTLSRKFENQIEVTYNDFSMRIDLPSAGEALNHTDAKILWYLMHKIQLARTADKTTLVVNFKSRYSMCRELGVIPNGDNYRRLEKALKKLTSVTYTFEKWYEKKKKDDKTEEKKRRYKIVFRGILSKFIINDEEDTVSVFFEEEFLKLNEGEYARIFNLPLMIAFKPTSARLYEIIETELYNREEGQWKIAIDKLAEKMCIDSTRANNTRNTLRNAVDDINTKIKDFKINKKFEMNIDERKKIVSFSKREREDEYI